MYNLTTPNAVFLTVNSRTIQLPVNPEKLEIKSPGDNITENVINLGEVSILRKAKLDTIVLESVIPAHRQPYMHPTASLISQQDFIDTIRTQVGDRKPVVLTVTNTNYSRGQTIEDFAYWWEGGDSDMHYRLELQYYRPSNTKLIQQVNSTVNQSAVMRAVSVVTSPDPYTGVVPVALRSRVLVDGMVQDLVTGYRIRVRSTYGVVQRSARGYRVIRLDDGRLVIQ